MFAQIPLRSVLLTACLALTFSAQAAVTNVAYWRLGENDPGAANGGLATSTTNLNGGSMMLAANPSYTNDVAATAITRVGSTLGLRFNGANYGTNVLVSALTNNFGLELWVKPAISNVTQCIAYNGNSGANGWGIYILSGQYQALFGAVGLVNSAQPAATNVWTHLALVRNNGTNVFYVNGAPAVTNTAAPNLPTGSFAVAVQPQTLTNEFFAGALDEVRGFSFAPGGFSTNDLLYVNAMPSATSLSAAETYTEDTALNLIDIVVTDADSANVTVTLTLSNPSAGILTTATAGAVTSTYNVGTGVWTASGAIANVNTLLAGMSFVPALNFNGNFTIATSVSDGVAPAISGSKAMTGTAVNDAPTASNLSAAETYTEDTPLNLIDIVASDVDSANVTATLTLSNPSAGTLNTGTSGAVTSTYNAGTGVWTASGAIANVNTLLAGLTFTPALNFNSNFTITTSVSDGALSVSGSKAMTGTPVNDAPVLDVSKTPSLAEVVEDSGVPAGAVGTLVSALVDFASPAGQMDNVTDVESGAQLGIAITAVDPNFTAYYSLNGGTTWTAAVGVSGTAARLLAADADNRIYLRPNPDVNGTFGSALAFRAWDQTTGSDGGIADTTSNGGTNAFSTLTDGIQQNVTPLNDAPVLDASKTPSLGAVVEDSGAPVGTVGVLVSSLVDFASPAGQVDNVTEVDAGALLGIAITDASTATGTWYYSTDNGTSWQGLGAVSPTNARLLAANANNRLYFQPNPNVEGVQLDVLTFRAWDQTSGTDGSLASTATSGGTSAFSAATDTAYIYVVPLNDAPVLDATKSPAMVAISEEAGPPVGAVGTPVSSLVDLAVPSGQLDNVTDVDESPLTGIAVTGANTANGIWLFTVNGGASWTSLGAVADSNARLLSDNPNNRLYFHPNLNFNGAIANGITFRAWDLTSGADGGTADTTSNGGTTAFSAATDTISQTVTPVNDAPTASNLSVAETYIEDTPLNLTDIVASDIDSPNVTATLTLSDVNAGTLSTGTSGAVTSTYNAGTGVWAASGAIADVNVLLAGIMFTPSSHYTNNFTIATSVSDGALSVSGSKAMTGFPAAGLIVTTTANSGFGSLRDVIAAAPVGSTITFATNLAGQTITLTNEIALAKNLNITASNLAANVIISGGGTTRIFYIGSGTITMKNLTLTGGNGVGTVAGSGGAIRQENGNLTLTLCTLAGNSAGSGGAIYRPGGAGPITLIQSTLSGNSATTGGAIRSLSAPTLIQCTLSGNSAVEDGGAIFTSSGPILIQCTVSGNSAGGSGGGIRATDNITATNSIIAGNLPVNISGTFTSSVSNLVDVAPLLAPLSNYGGPTQTQPPLPGSPALDTGSDSVTNTYTTDQRGLPRLVGARVDIGAVEGALDASAPIVTTTAASAIGQNAATINATVNPRNLATTAWFEWGTTTNYGNVTTANPVAAINTAIGLNQSLGGLATSATYHFRAVATNLLGLTQGADSFFTTLPITGDQNGDGIVSESEINAAFANYLATSPWLYLTNVAGLGGTNVTFALDNAPALSFTVEYSTNLVDWFPLGLASPRYLFTDTNAPAVPQRSYRLRYP